MIKNCIFDLDGTLLNTLTTITYYVNKTLKQYGISEITEDECRVFVGNGARKLIERVCYAKRIDDRELCDRILHEYVQAYNDEPLYLTEAYAGIYELIDRLNAQGISLAVLSNKPDETAKDIVARFFPGRFKAVMGGREGVRLKPYADAALEILSELGAKADETAFIGDTSVDILTGKNMGASLTVGVLWGFRDRHELEDAGADAIVADTEELFSEVLSSEK